MDAIHGKYHVNLVYTNYHSPWRIVDDMGGAFAMGALGGGAWHAVRGAKNSPIVGF